jgi:hypothetical protein
MFQDEAQKYQSACGCGLMADGSQSCNIDSMESCFTSLLGKLDTLEQDIIFSSLLYESKNI